MQIACARLQRAFDKLERRRLLEVFYALCLHRENFSQNRWVQGQIQELRSQLVNQEPENSAVIRQTLQRLGVKRIQAIAFRRDFVHKDLAHYFKLWYHETEMQKIKTLSRRRVFNNKNFLREKFQTIFDLILKKKSRLYFMRWLAAARQDRERAVQRLDARNALQLCRALCRLESRLLARAPFVQKLVNDAMLRESGIERFFGAERTSLFLLKLALETIRQRAHPLRYAVAQTPRLDFEFAVHLLENVTRRHFRNHLLFALTKLQSNMDHSQRNSDVFIQILGRKERLYLNVTINIHNNGISVGRCLWRIALR